ncbi:class I SAM-dependent methyltransferase [Gimesia aquarii]|uniref:Demethylrebeccamycin-D-glucose O-methyltransferase n=1 Tax=Gimesia aquarii TaxID=2527964 RepID=A0A517WQA6_9PLAN|nr:class I SAM-dependent methyltransferase [Gimesia aquarii]QDU07442.1 Demethylrebeccamycin-D-glucose O-methyltransferase [Gimesia aquarii]
MDQEIVWQYDEFKQIGKDYSSQSEVEVYDSSHATFRDLEAESLRVLDLLELKESDALIEFGSGSGTFALMASQRCRHVHAVDVSLAMLDLSREKTSHAGVSNIEYHHAGFLTYEHRELPVQAVATTLALHHLPDFWKGVALKRVHNMLSPNGKLYINDVILEETNATENIKALIEHQAAVGGDFMREDAEAHFREEFSTYDWVMEGLLKRSGFTIVSKSIEGGVLGTYLCRRSA